MDYSKDCSSPKECVCPADREFGQAVTPTGDAKDDLLFGTDVLNGFFTTGADESGCIEVGLRAKQRLPPENAFNNNGADGIYSWPTNSDADSDENQSPTPLWNFEWAVNVAANEGCGDSTIGDYCYELGLDADPSHETDFTIFDPITPSDLVSCWDHAFGDNDSTNANAVSASCLTPEDPEYADLIQTFNAAQQSWNYEFFNFPGTSLYYFDSRVPGSYIIYLRVIDCDNGDNPGVVVAETFIEVRVGGFYPLRDRVCLPGEGHDEDMSMPTTRALQSFLDEEGGNEEELVFGVLVDEHEQQHGEEDYVEYGQRHPLLRRLE